MGCLMVHFGQDSLSIPLTKDLVLVGGGHTHALLLMQWAANPLPGTRVTVINPACTAPYTGMLPGHVAGHYQRHELDIDIARLAIRAGARFIRGSTQRIDPDSRKIWISARPPIEYDILSLNIGIHSGMPNIPGASDWAHPAKPLDQFARQWERFIDDVGEGRDARVAVIGGGIAGVELALAMHHRLRSTAPGPVTVSVFEQGERLLSELGPMARRALLRSMKRAGIEWQCGVSVASIDHQSITLTDSVCHNIEFVALAAGSRPHTWLHESGLADSGGFVPTDGCLQVIGRETIFAAGDCARFTPRPLPRAGVYAVRQAPVLYRNLRAVLQGRPCERFHPQTHFLKLVSTGPRHAVGCKYGLAIAGKAIWQLKDRIDRRFMRKFTDMPAMTRAIPPLAAHGVREIMLAAPTVCSGCGGKVGREALETALGSMMAAATLSRLDDAACLDVKGAQLLVSTDHLNAMTDDPWLFARIAAAHAASDIWAMGALPHSALVTAVLPRMNEPLQIRTLTDIMDGVQSCLESEGVRIIGGHTTQGSELAVGLTVLGDAPARTLTKSGAEPGDSLVLTKPLGTGVILAGAMAGEVNGDDLVAALDRMQTTSAAASRVLARHATAMTDITGFGLAGHLHEILQASNVAAHLDLDHIPLLPGALELADKGIRSSLWSANAHLLTIDGPANDPRIALLFDPQTSGGLLATLPSEAIKTLVADARQHSIECWQIGRIETGPPALCVESTRAS